MAGSHKNTPKREPRGTGSPAPGKDRSAHEQARGKKVSGNLKSLLGIVDLEPHFEDIFDDLDHQSDRGAALIAAALIDTGLGRLIRTKLMWHKDLEADMFEKEGAPLATFSAKIKTARALGAIGPLVQGHCGSIRRIRNIFAHSVLKLDLTHKEIAAEIEGLLPDQNKEWKADLNLSVQRRRFVWTALSLAQAIEQRTDEHMNDRHDAWLP